MKRLYKRVLSLSAAAVLMLMSSAAVFADEGEGEYTYIDAYSETQLLIDKAAVEASYVAKGEEDGKVYELTWTEREELSTGNKIKDGDSQGTDFGPYTSRDAAQAAMNKDKSEDSSTAYREITYSEITETENTSGESKNVTYTSDVEYSSIDECQAAIDAKINELTAEGFTDVTASGPVVSSSEIVGIECRELIKKDYAATSYEMDGCDFIVVKQSTWFAIWTENEISEANSSKIREFVEKKDGGCAGKTYLGMWHGFGTVFHGDGTGKSGEYSVVKGSNGKFVLNVSDKEKISHMDYGTFDVQTSDKYTFSISCTAPASKIYYFTKTVQKYKDEVKYRMGYKVKISEKPIDPPSSTSEPTTATDPSSPTDSSNTEESTEITGSTGESTAATDETTKETEKTEPTSEFSTEEGGTTVNETEPSGTTTEAGTTAQTESTEVSEESESETLVYDSSSDDPADPSKTNPLIYDPTASAGDNGAADKSAKTGDNINVGAIAAVLILSGLGAAGALLYRRKKA